MTRWRELIGIPFVVNPLSLKNYFFFLIMFIRKITAYRVRNKLSRTRKAAEHNAGFLFYIIK